jgi:hypothetical protein
MMEEFRPPSLKLGYVLPMIASKSCPDCTKPFVGCHGFRHFSLKRLPNHLRLVTELKLVVQYYSL